MSDDQEIKDVREEELQRGKRHPASISEMRRRTILRRKFKEALQSNDEAAFIEAIVNDLGQLPASPEYESSLKIWREFRGRH
jgi:hypothetical protein